MAKLVFPRSYTKQLLVMVNDGLVDKDNLIRDLLNWMSEDDVREFAINNEYIEDDEEE